MFWPKIKTFLWLLMRRKTLTWENLCKKGFKGPSKCPQCNQAEETMNHLFKTCEWANHLWRWMETIMQQTNRDRDSIRNTIMNWPSEYSNNLRINSIWKVLPGFITWTIWKERNRRIFQNEHRNIEHSQITLTQNIRQLILVKCRVDPDNQASAEDQRILNAFNLINEQNMGSTER